MNKSFLGIGVRAWLVIVPVFIFTFAVPEWGHYLFPSPGQRAINSMNQYYSAGAYSADWSNTEALAFANGCMKTNNDARACGCVLSVAENNYIPQQAATDYATPNNLTTAIQSSCELY